MLAVVIAFASLPTRERGLKYVLPPPSRRIPSVAPYTGAWIEIVASAYVAKSGMVAPYTGAWIEISESMTQFRPIFVAPYTGAWIEIPSVSQMIYPRWSLPTRERGLKFSHPIAPSVADGRSLHGSVD